MARALPGNNGGREPLRGHELDQAINTATPDVSMNPIERAIRRVDGVQQQNPFLSIVFAVVKKYGDDNAGILVGSLTQSAFGALFPLLLLLITILGIILGGDPSLRHQVMNSTLTQFPIIGNDLSKNIKTLHRNSAFGLIVGIIGLTWGSMGLAQNGIFTMEQVWNLPGPARPNYIKRLGRSVTFLAVLGVGLIVTTALATGVTSVNGSLWMTVAAGVVSAALNVAAYLFGFRVLTPHAVPLRQLVPGAIMGGIIWTILQEFGGFVVGHYLKNDSAVYGMFGIVLGLLAWLYIIIEVTVYAAELNVVLARRLWPRAMVQPPLTEADRMSLAAQAQQNQRRPEQHVDVRFDGEALTEKQLREQKVKAEHAAHGVTTE